MQHKIEFKKNGITTTFQTSRVFILPPVKKENSKITNFSTASRRRLRERIMDYHPESGWVMWSATHTIPGEILSDQMQTKLWSDFSKNFLNREKLACIWRKEIQSRGQAHWHCIYFLPDYYREYNIVLAWLNCLKNVDDKKRDEIYNAKSKSVDLTPITDTAIWCRYMQDHLTKHKKNQIATSGRHWGIVNRKYLTKREISECFNVSEDVWNKYRRVQRRLFRPFRKKNVVPFGYCLGFDSKRGVVGRSDFFSENSKKEKLKKESYVRFKPRQFFDIR